MVEDIYKNLLTSRVSSKCNDASVVLRTAWGLFRRGLPETKNMINLRCVTEISLEVRLLVDAFAKKPLKVQNKRLQGIVGVGMANLRACFDYDGAGLTFNLEMSADVFLQMALSIEEMLGDLLEAECQHRSEKMGVVDRIIDGGRNDKDQQQTICYTEGLRDPSPHEGRTRIDALRTMELRPR